MNVRVGKDTRFQSIGEKKMWEIANQEQIETLNEALNEQWSLLVHLKELMRWNSTDGLRNDLDQLWEITERISEALNTAILWEQFA